MLKVELLITNGNDGMEYIVFYNDGTIGIASEDTWILFDGNGNKIENVYKLEPTSDHYRLFEEGNGKCVNVPPNAKDAFFAMVEKLVKLL